MSQVIIVGCGYVGGRLAKAYREQGRSVVGLKRAPGAGCLLYDLEDGELPEGIVWEDAEVVYMAPPSRQGVEDTRMRRFLSQIRGRGIKKLVYYSTTGVYGDCEGKWVTEQSLCNPNSDRARRRLDAERRVQAFESASVILRVSGIYGPGRVPVERVKLSAPIVKLAESPWGNRIHVEDLVNVTLNAMENGRGIYNVSDGKPEKMSQLYIHIAEMIGVESPPELPLEKILETASPMMREFLSCSRKVDNLRMIDELGVEVKYGDWREGLRASF